MTLYSAGCISPADRRKPAEGWNLLEIGRVGWVDIEKDAERLPSRTTEVLSYSTSFLLAGEGSSRYVVYYPAADGLTGRWNAALKVARFDPAEGADSITRSSVGEDVFVGEDLKYGYTSGLAMDATEGENGLQLWYFHPYDRLLVRCDLSSGERKTWDFTKILPMYNVSWNWDSHWLDFHVQPEERRVEFVLYKHGEGVAYADYDLDTGDFREEKLDLNASPWIVPVGGETWLMTLAEERLLRLRRREDGGSGEGEWEMNALASVPIFRGEVLIFTDTRDRLHALLWDYSYSILHYEPDGELYRVERLRKVPRGEARKRRDDNLFFAVSAAYSPDGNLHLAWFDPLEERVQHVWREDGRWWRENVVSAEDVYSTAILHTGDRVLISYVDLPRRTVFVASSDAAAGESARQLDVPAPVHYLPMGGKKVACLHWAAMGDVEMVSRLLDLGAGLDGRLPNGSTALHWAAVAGNIEIVDLLLAEGATPKVRDEDGFTPLHVAVAGGNPEVVKRLVRAGCSVNAADKGGGTPLHLAVEQGKTGIAEVLLENGADVHAEDDRGRTPLKMAEGAGNERLLELLRGYR